ncbi:PDR/VanB family oxidoreductase [Massilia cavernae]|uniref:Oxidoreductase n=1 Tax=Massilia cavernae TaxID=2320864 RepID=A0A418XDX3_9BURK|nr:PDR/VanB family oxidoreductase [Massilia cavernae]RJG10734.1 oxidoreductase [Massilia cavernae]
MELLIRSMKSQAEDIVSLELVSPSGEPLPAFSAGAHIDLVLGNGLTRSYSLVNDQSERDRYVIAVNKDPSSRGGSRYVHETLRARQSIEVSAPRNHFPLVEDAPQVVFIAGGIGVTPLLCMIRRLDALGRPWKLFYSARSRRKCAYLTELLDLDRDRGNVRFHFVDECDGRLPDMGTLVAPVPGDAHLYCCGPSPMLNAFERATAARPAENVHVEYFSAQQEAVVSGGFTVVLARSRREVRVEPGNSILDALLGDGVDVGHACKEGVCGACQTKVLDGVPDHRDSYLTSREKNAGDTIMLCCSGSVSDTLVLDL